MNPSNNSQSQISASSVLVGDFKNNYTPLRIVWREAFLKAILDNNRTKWLVDEILKTEIPSYLEYLKIPRNEDIFRQTDTSADVFLTALAEIDRVTREMNRTIWNMRSELETRSESSQKILWELYDQFDSLINAANKILQEGYMRNP